ncbi:MAG: ABC transporter permease subunit [Planctomycetota bacterium]
MIAAVIHKSWRDSWMLLVVAFLALISFEMLVVRALSELPADSARMWLERPLLRDFMRVLLGADLAAALTPTGLMTVGFGHPFVYALTWAILVTLCTRTTVGEIDRGTADLLLSLPSSRAAIFLGTSSVWVLAGIPVCLGPLIGIWIGERWCPLWEPVNFGRLMVVSVNLWLLYLCVGGLTVFVSGLVIRRGNAIAAVLAIVLASVLLNFIAMLWPAAERVAFLGILHYYRPLPCIRSEDWPLSDMLVLGTVAALGWMLGMWRFCRRDIPAA